MQRLTVSIPDLTCASCVPGIEQVMREQEGVIWAIVNFAAREATVIYDPLNFYQSKFVQSISQLGYQIVVNAQPARQPQSTANEPKQLSRVHRWVQTIHHQSRIHCA